MEAFNFNLQRFATGVSRYNTLDNQPLTGSAGDDTINNIGASVTIDAGAGDDLIFAQGNKGKVTINGGAGNDTIIFDVATLPNNLIEYTEGDGNDFIVGFNDSSTLKIGGGTGTYSTTKSGNNLFVGVGKDTITLVGAASLTGNIQGKLTAYTPVPPATKHITLNANANTYINSIEGATIEALGGDDNLLNAFASVSINAGDGNDTIYNYGSTVTISGGDGKDSIDNRSDSVTIDGGDGDDSIENYRGNFVTIHGGTGNDTIRNYEGEKVTISGGEGNDSILNDRGASVSITGGAGDDTIYNRYSGSNVTISGGASNDLIYNIAGDNVSIDGGDGDDSIYNIAGDNVSIDGGAGDDSIRNYDGDNVSIDGGDGDDSIENYGGWYVSINGGAGDDTISLSSNAKNNLIEHTDGDGNDFILGFNATSTLKIGGGTGTYSTTKSGNNLFVCVGNDTITLVGAASLAGNIVGSLKTYTPATPASKNIKLTEGADIGINSIEGATILALDGDDNLFNVFAGVSIDAGAGNDSVKNYGDSITIDGGAGNDDIDNEGTNVTIIGGEGNDTIDNLYASSVSIDGGNGDDSIENYRGNFVTIDAGTGNDSITNGGSDVTIDGGAGDDSITNYGDNVSIDGGDGDDTIKINGTNVSIDGGTGDDSISNVGTNVLINAGDGNDSITNYASNVTVDAGDGNDSINNYGSNVTINASDGKDTVWGFDGDDTLKIGDGTDTYSKANVGNDVVVTSGDGSVLLMGAATLDAVNISGTDKSSVDTTDPNLIKLNEDNNIYTNITGNGVTIQAFGGDDSVRNSYTNVSIDGGTGNDSIYNDGSKVSIDGGAGNDSIYNRGSNATIDGGTGNDSIYNDGSKVSIDGGAGNDYISNRGSNATIDGGAGNDSIYNRGSNATIDGGADNDYISNGDFSYSSIGAYSNVDGGAGNDRIKNSGYNVTIHGGAGNDYIENTGEDDFIFGDDGDDTIFNPNAYISGFSRNPQGTTIYAGAGNDSIGTSGNKSIVDAGTGNDTIIVYREKITAIGGAGDDKISLDGNSANSVIKYTSGDGNDIVWRFGGDDTLQIGGGSGTYSTQQSGDDIIVTVGDGSVLLKDAATLDAVNIAGEEGTPADNWTLTDGVAKYKNLFTLSGINPNLTVDELDAAITIDGNKVILSADALGKSNVTLTTTGNYSLALDDDCPTVTATEKSWTLDGTTATYHDAGKSDGYKLTNSKTVTYTPAVVGKALLTVSGVVEGVSEEDLNENLTVSGKVLTVTPDVVGENFSVGAGYKVVFGEGNYGGSKFTGTTRRDTIEVNGSNLQIDGGKGNDTVTSNGDGGNIYLIASTVGADVVVGYGDDDTVKITDGSSVTASVKASDIIVKAGKATMTLKNAATGTHLNIVDADDETLIDQTFYADRTVADGEVKLLSTFNSTSFTATDENPNVDGSAVSRKFSLTGGDEDNTLIGGKGANFINGGGGENQLTGGKGNDTFVAGNGTDTITDYGVGTDKISLAADVTGFEVDGSDVILNFDDDKSMRIENGAGKKINFVRNGRTTPEIFMTGGKLSSNSKSITLASGTGSFDAGTVTTLVTIDGGLTENVFITGNAQSNKIFGGDGSDTLDGGAKNDTLTGGDGNDIFIYESGKDVIADYVSGKDKISLAAAPTSESLNSKGDVVLKFSVANQLTIKGGDEILFVTDGGEVTKTYLNDRIVGDDGVTLQSNFKATEFTLEELPKVDASATSAKITITGNNNDNTIIGSKGNNLIDGGAGDDILIGKGGADTFVYSSGDDTISDYESRDKVSLTSAIENYDLSGDDVIIGFGSSSLTIANAANDSVTFVEEVNGKVTTSVNVFASEGIFNGKRTAVTLNADTSNYTANSSMLTIDGGLASDAIEIVGNAKANKIFAGDFGSTLNGGGGKDSLWGGNGSDTFIYSSGGGNDVIYGFGDEDALQIVGKFTASVVGEDVTFKVGSTANAVTLKDYSATTFNVNGDTYRINGNNFVK